MLAKERVHGGVGGGQQGAGMRGRRSSPGRSAATLDHDDRLARGDVPAELGESTRVPERFQVQQQDVGAFILGPVTRADRCRRYPPCSRSKRRTTGPPAGTRRGSSPRSRGLPTGTGIRSCRREETRRRRCRSTEPVDRCSRCPCSWDRPGGSPGTTPIDQLVLEFDPRRARLSEAGRDHDQRPHALLDAVIDDLQHRP